MSASVRIGDRKFVCDEEPHFLGPENGYGYNPLKIGDQLQGQKFMCEVVGKLGFGICSSVWLGRYCE